MRAPWCGSLHSLPRAGHRTVLFLGISLSGDVWQSTNLSARKVTTGTNTSFTNMSQFFTKIIQRQHVCFCLCVLLQQAVENWSVSSITHAHSSSMKTMDKIFEGCDGDVTGFLLFSVHYFCNCSAVLLMWQSFESNCSIMCECNEFLLRQSKVYNARL
jgi:hypothetical protein